MNCPYCKQQLFVGYLYGDRNPIVWMPEDKKPVLGLWTDGEEINNCKSNFMQLPRIKAYRCNECKKMIINLENE